MVKNLFSPTRTREVLTVSRSQLIMLNRIETRFLVHLAFRAEMLRPGAILSWRLRNLENIKMGGESRIQRFQRPEDRSIKYRGQQHTSAETENNRDMERVGPGKGPLRTAKCFVLVKVERTVVKLDYSTGAN